MYIPQDIVSLTIDQLVWETVGATQVASRYGMVCPSMLARELRATSLVSTQWVDRSQHYLFSIVTLYREEHVREWCSRITPDPHGVSRHVRVLYLRISALHRHFVKAALPNLTSFQNLQELVVHHEEPRISCVSLDDLASIFSSFATTLKRLQWTQEPITSDAWKILQSHRHFGKSYGDRSV